MAKSFKVLKEAVVERALVRGVKALGGRCIKLQGQGNRNMPDRLVVLPFGWASFVELKAPGRKPRPGQVRELTRLNNLGHRAIVLDSLEAVRVFLKAHEWRKLK